MRKSEKELKIVIRGEGPRVRDANPRCRYWMLQDKISSCVGFRVVMDALDSCKEQASVVK
jgi:hypothetical protein